MRCPRIQLLDLGAERFILRAEASDLRVQVSDQVEDRFRHVKLQSVRAR